MAQHPAKKLAVPVYTIRLGSATRRFRFGNLAMVAIESEYGSLARFVKAVQAADEGAFYRLLLTVAVAGLAHAGVTTRSIDDVATPADLQAAADEIMAAFAESFGLVDTAGAPDGADGAEGDEPQDD